MAKLGQFSGREVCRLSIEYGFVEVRRRGSHIVMQRKSDAGTTTIPVPDHKTLRVGSLRSIIRQSGLDRVVIEK